MNDNRREQLIDRVIDGRADDRDCRDLESIAERDPAVWRDLAHSQRDQAALVGLMNRAESVAARVETPTPGTHETAGTHGAHEGAGAASGGRHTQGTRRHAGPLAHDARAHAPTIGMRFGAWLGWGLAAALLIAWNLDRVRTDGVMPTPDQGVSAMQEAGIVPVSNAQEALNAYLQKGREEQRVIREMPRMILIDSRPDPSGAGYELIYIRQVMERTVVPNLYQFNGRDENGQPALVPYRQTSGSKM